MRPRGNALPPCQQRAGAPLCGTRSQTNAVAPEAGACVAWNSSPVLLCHPHAHARHTFVWRAKRTLSFSLWISFLNRVK